MDNWLTILITVIVIVMVIGNYSTFQKSSKHKMRKTNLNDRQETLPRTKRNTHKKESIDKSKR